MSPGSLAEEVGTTVRSFITAMKDHPAVLILGLCNMLLIGFIFYALSAAATFRTDLIRQNFEFQKQMAELLARCNLTDNDHGDESMSLHDSTFGYVEPTAEQAAVLEEHVPDGPDKTYLLRKLREVSMWANISIMRNADGAPRT